MELILNFGMSSPYSRLSGVSSGHIFRVFLLTKLCHIL